MKTLFDTQLIESLKSQHLALTSWHGPPLAHHHCALRETGVSLLSFPSYRWECEPRNMIRGHLSPCCTLSVTSVMGEQ